MILLLLYKVWDSGILSVYMAMYSIYNICAFNILPIVYNMKLCYINLYSILNY